VVDNVTDVYTTTPAIEHVVSLTQAQYNAISASADPNTLYYITDAPSFVVSASFAANVGFVRGSAPNSMRNANILVTTPATASGTGSIAIGNNARNYADYSVVIGDSAQNYDSARINSVYIGRNAGGAQNSVGIGYGATVLSDSSVGVGRDSAVSGDYSLAIGYNSRVSVGTGAQGGIAIGRNTTTLATDEINIGNKFTFNSASNGLIELKDDLNVLGNITVVSSSFSGSVINNITDVYTSTAVIEHVISLTQAEYNAISASADPNTLYYITDAVLSVVSASYAATASFFSLAAVNQDVVITGSVRGNVQSLMIGSNTASMDLSSGNFFDLTIVSGSNTYINPTNIAAGQTVNLKINQPNPGNGTVSFPSSVKQASGFTYAPTTGSGATDIVTLIAFDNTTLYLSNVKNLV